MLGEAAFETPFLHAGWSSRRRQGGSRVRRANNYLINRDLLSRDYCLAAGHPLTTPQLRSRHYVKAAHRLDSSAPVRKAIPLVIGSTTTFRDREDSQSLQEPSYHLAMSAAAAASAAEGGNPLLEALPPATDYITYLTIIEYNLTPENLPTLHDVLQDEKLTTNIGWDLVHLLLPLLPASQQCLEDIARLGNPREVILKVTECLRLIDFAGLEPDSDLEEAEDAPKESPLHRHPHTTAPVSDQGDTAHGTTQAVEIVPTPLAVDQFVCLLSMLAILHRRIKTEFPSRFLSTSLQAILHAFSNSVSHREELVSSIVRFVKESSGTKRPHLPARVSSSSLMQNMIKQQAPDPESESAAEKPALSESDMQTRLLQSLITHVADDYMLSLSFKFDAPGLSWAARLQEKLHPDRIVPGKPSMTKMYQSQPVLHSRLTTVGELLALSQDLGITTNELLEAANSSETPSTKIGSEESEPPTAATDIPLSKTGSLLLYTARTIGKSLYSSKKAELPISIFPSHRQLMSSFVADANSGGMTIGSEPEALLDALLALALQTVDADHIGTPEDTEKFNGYLQTMSLISSNCPSPSLRYIAFYITSTILRSNPSDLERLAFIRDTLEHCPFDNLKVAAISWIKGETIEANEDRPTSSASVPNITGRDDVSIFATPVAIDSLSPYLFPDLTHDLSATSLSEAWAVFDQNMQFYVASLNFYFLLLSAQHLQQGLNIASLHINHDIGGSFIGPLKEAVGRFREGARPGGELEKRWKAESDVNAEAAKLELMDATIEKVNAAVVAMNGAKQVE